MRTKKEISNFQKCLKQHNKRETMVLLNINTVEVTRLNVLHLVISKEPFDVMVTGEKTIEYREPTKWIKSRLMKPNGEEKVYNFIKFTHGYQPNAPYFICKYVRFGEVTKEIDGVEVKFSNGLAVTLKTRMYMIQCGEIVERGNIV